MHINDDVTEDKTKTPGSFASLLSEALAESKKKKDEEEDDDESNGDDDEDDSDDDDDDVEESRTGDKPMNIAEELRSILDEAKFGAGGAGGYAVEVARGLQMLDSSIKVDGTGFKKGSVEGDIKVSEVGDGSFRVEVKTHGRKPASLMFTTKASVKSVAKSSLPKDILAKLDQKDAFAESVDGDDGRLEETVWSDAASAFSKKLQARLKADGLIEKASLKTTFPLKVKTKKQANASYVSIDHIGPDYFDQIIGIVREMLPSTAGVKTQVSGMKKASPGPLGLEITVQFYASGVSESLDEGATPGARSKGTGHGRGETSASGEFWSGKADKMDAQSGRKKRFNKAQRQGKQSHIDAQMRGEGLSDSLADALAEEEEIPGDIIESVMDSEAFATALTAAVKPKIGNKYLLVSYRNNFNSSHANVIVTFVNGEQSKLSGAEAMNNRVLFSIDGFAHELGQPPPSGKVTLKTMSGRKEFRLKGKTGTPEAIIKYLSDHIEKIAELAQF